MKQFGSTGPDQHPRCPNIPLAGVSIVVLGTFFLFATLFNQQEGDDGTDRPGYCYPSNFAITMNEDHFSAWAVCCGAEISGSADIGVLPCWSLQFLGYLRSTLQQGWKALLVNQTWLNWQTLLLASSWESLRSKIGRWHQGGFALMWASLAPGSASRARCRKSRLKWNFCVTGTSNWTWNLSELMILMLFGCTQVRTYISSLHYCYRNSFCCFASCYSCRDWLVVLLLLLLLLLLYRLYSSCDSCCYCR